jgi:predicted metal-dependent HD superfamily phosphohydrolase
MIWSRIQDTDLGNFAYWRIVSNEIKGCEYHNWDHVSAMYKHLQDTNVPYDEALDWAVLFHDMVYDAEPNKEQRSAELFIDMAAKYAGCNLSQFDQFSVTNLILRTADHRIELNMSAVEIAIIRADLHALTDKTKTIQNFVKIMNESINLYSCTVEEFAYNTSMFMEELRERVILNVLLSEGSDISFFNKVLAGIDTTINLAEAIQ